MNQNELLKESYVYTSFFFFKKRSVHIINLVCHWLSFDLAHPVLLSNHFIQFDNLASTSKAKTSIMFLI